MSVLAIGAHPDDIEFGAYGLLYSLKSRQTITSAVLTDGRLGGYGRWYETLRVLRAFGRTVLPPAEDFRDGSLVMEMRRCVQFLDKLLDELQPSIVLTHAPGDTHQDHRTVWEATLAACRRRPVGIIGYYTASSSWDPQPNMRFDITKLLRQKINSLQEHTSQLDKAYFNPAWLRAWHQDKDSLLRGPSFIEPFYIHSCYVTV